LNEEVAKTKHSRMPYVYSAVLFEFRTSVD